MSRSRSGRATSRPPPSRARSSRSANERTIAWAVSLGLLALVVAIYAQTAHHPFVALDDDTYVLGSPQVARGLSGDHIVWAFTHAYAANWHPLTWISHMIDCQLFGVTDADAGAHHLVSMGWHALNAILLFHAFRRLGGDLWIAAAIAALFAVHPLRVESVAWASERKDVLSGAFFMLALLAYAQYARRNDARARGWALAAQVAGLMSKPTLVSLPLVFLALDVWPLRRAGRVPMSRLLREKIPFFAASAAAAMVTFLAQRSEGAVAPTATIPLGARLANLPVAIVTYVSKTVWPSGLACLYPHPATLAPDPLWTAKVIGASLLVAAAVVIAWRERRRRPYLLAGALWFLVALLPMAGIVQVGNQGWADRYAYLPTIGLYAAGVAFARELSASRPALRRALVWGGAVVVAALALVAHRQTQVWASTQTLYRHAVAVTRDNWFAESALGGQAMKQGRADEAERWFEQSLSHLSPRLRPGYREAHNNLGLLYLQQQRFDEARRELNQALAADPGFPEAQNNLALLSLRLGRFAEARDHAGRAVASRPDFADAHFNWALALQAEGHLEEAAAHFERVVALQPEDAEAHAQLGRVLVALARPGEARDQLRAALRLAPDHPWAQKALEDLERTP